MTKLPRVTGKEIVRALKRNGFICKDIEGSHYIMQKTLTDGKITIPVPVHSGKIIKLRTLHGILNKARVSKEQLTDLL